MGKGKVGQGRRHLKKRRETEREIRGESQAPLSWVQPVVMVTAVRQDERQTGRFTPSWSQPLFMCLTQTLVDSWSQSLVVFFSLPMKNSSTERRPPLYTWTSAVWVCLCMFYLTVSSRVLWAFFFFFFQVEKHKHETISLRSYSKESASIRVTRNQLRCSAASLPKEQNVKWKRPKTKMFSLCLYLKKMGITLLRGYPCKYIRNS